MICIVLAALTLALGMVVCVSIGNQGLTPAQRAVSSVVYWPSELYFDVGGSESWTQFLALSGVVWTLVFIVGYEALFSVSRMKRTIRITLILVAVGGILLGLRDWWLWRQHDRRYLVRVAEMSLEGIRALGELVENDCGGSGLFTNLAFAVEDPGIAGWRGPYTNNLTSRTWPPRDPWDSAVRVTIDANGRRMSSAGPDRRFGTEDDITVNWPQNTPSQGMPREARQR